MNEKESAARIAELERERAEFEADAKRYKYLRECQSIPADILRNHHEQLDNAIDALTATRAGAGGEG